MSAPSQDAVENVIYGISNVVGTYAYSAYGDDKRRWIDQAIVGAIALALLKDYISGFIDLKSVAKEHRSHLSSLLARIKGNPAAPPISVPPALKEIETARELLASESNPAQLRANATQRLKQSLVELGMDDEAANKAAAKIEKSIHPLIDSTR